MGSLSLTSVSLHGLSQLVNTSLGIPITTTIIQNYLVAGDEKVTRVKGNDERVIGLGVQTAIDLNEEVCSIE